MLPSTWSEGQIVVRAVEVAQTPALHAAVTECVDIVALDPTFAEVPESTVGELVERISRTVPLLTYFMGLLCHYAVIRKCIPNARVIRITVANVGLPSSDKAL